MLRAGALRRPGLWRWELPTMTTTYTTRDVAIGLAWFAGFMALIFLAIWGTALGLSALLPI